MAFKFVPKKTVDEIDPVGPIPPPPEDRTFEYFYWGPYPEFLICVARVTSVESETKFKCIFYNPKTGKELAMQPVLVVLDRINAWKPSPSTLPEKLLPMDVTPGKKNCVLLLISLEWMKDNVPKLHDVYDSDPQFFKKHPPGEDGYAVMAKAINALAKALKAKGGNPLSLPDFVKARLQFPKGITPFGPNPPFP